MRTVALKESVIWEEKHQKLVKHGQTLKYDTSIGEQ